MASSVGVSYMETMQNNHVEYQPVYSLQGKLVFRLLSVVVVSVHNKEMTVLIVANHCCARVYLMGLQVAQQLSHSSW